MKIRFKLFLLIIIISIIPLILISIFSFYNYYTTIMEHTESNILNQLQTQKEAIIKFFTPINELTGYVSANLEKNGLNWMFQNFPNIVNSFSEITHIYVVLQDGTFIIEPATEIPKEYKPIESIWAKKAMISDQIVVTPLYIQPITKLPTLTFAKSFVSSSREGVLGLDINYESFISIISKFSYQSQINYIVDSENNILASTASNSKYFIPQLENDMGVITQNNEYIYYLKVPEFNWTILSSINRQEIISEPLRKSLNIALLALIVIILAVVLSVFFMRSITNPIDKMKEKVNLIEQGNLNVDFDTSSNDEIGIISKELAYMINKLKTTFSQVKETSINIEKSSKELSYLSEKFSKSEQDILTKTEDIEKDLEDSAAFTEEVTSGVDEVARAAQGVSQDAQRLSEEAEKTNEAAHQGSQIIISISEAVKEAVEQTKESQKEVEKLASNAKDVQNIVE
ncbi:methyl-accepting chemotaxis protein, partial [Petrotoga sp. 9PWA.NaAc.5.4]|uniref:methyl-accepting chemotaxis protein n=1 Tax=Petrotoga sp. 9PWA.NaAc.5.4 TaxID=1434328 RepID=UPI000CC7EE6F